MTLVFTLSACAAPKGESWPTVSFGDDIAVIESSIDGPSGVTLAPLPGLTDEEMAGAENPVAFFSDARQDYFSLQDRLAARRVDFNAAKAAALSSTGDDLHQNWLAAQMELSNISQATEAVKTLRARFTMVQNDVPEAAGLLAAAEELELEFRRFVLNERLNLAENKR